LGAQPLVSLAAPGDGGEGNGDEGEAEVTPTPDPANPPPPTPVVPDILLKPALGENPTLADEGKVYYWSVCMACHGDHGQGLTDEFRLEAFGEDMNCWVSRCHASNHPPEGFDFPRYVPALIGSGTLTRFVNAYELYEYIQRTMPWWNPGTLKDHDAWSLTAFLLRENGALAQDMELDTGALERIPVHLSVRSTASEEKGLAVLLGVFGLGILSTLAISFQKPAGATASAVKARPNFFHHLHPPTLPMRQASWRYTLGAGGISVFLVLVIVLTGILEMFFYIPTPDQAARSVQIITFMAPYGSLVRGLHFWSAQALVVTSALHLLRVLLTGAYHQPRRFNYLLGLALFVLVLLFDFTGYVLRWDEGIRWALLVGTNLLQTIPWVGEALYGWVVGGSEPGLATLTRFYAWHIFGLTLLVGILLTWHLFRVRRDGGISAPPPELRNDPRRISRFELAATEGRAALLVGLGLLLLAALVRAPLDAPIQENQLGSLIDTRAPWFFLWIQYLLRYGDAFWLGVALPLAAVGLLAALPFIASRLPPEQQGRWFPPAGRLAQVIGILMALGWIVLTLLEL
jgi:quinol-cytochrome oxidoreductase complex cytochrome b subunit